VIRRPLNSGRPHERYTQPRLIALRGLGSPRALRPDVGGAARDRGHDLGLGRTQVKVPPGDAGSRPPKPDVRDSAAMGGTV
jgi:hypothetical protein